MADDGLKYDVMVERALRGVLREALSYIAESGLPGDHHFYITFRTDHPDAEVPDVLHDRYPGEMTIVLQHQFWDLEVGEDLFAVTLSFTDVPQRLGIPFDSVIAFADPSVHFGLQFDSGPGDEEAAVPVRSAQVAMLPVGEGEVEAVERTAEPKAAEAKTRSVKKAESGDQPEAEPVPDSGEDDPEKIISLDTFRKK